MSSTSGSSRQSELRRQLDEIIRGSAPLPINWDDPDHRPIMGGSGPAAEQDENGFAPLSAMVRDFYEESGAKDEELRDWMARATKAIDAPADERGDNHVTTSSSGNDFFRRRSERSIYASRKANDLEILTTVAPILEKSCRTPLDAALLATLTGLQTFAAILIEKIDDLGRSETIGASLVYRGDRESRFLASPLYTVVDLAPDIFAYSASHLVRVVNDEVRRACDVGKVAYVAESTAHAYKAVVQMTAHCQFHALHADARSTLHRSLASSDTDVLPEQDSDDAAWLELLLARARGDDNTHVLDVAISSVSKTIDAVTLPDLKRKISQTLKQFFGEISVLSSYRERAGTRVLAPPAPVNTLIHDALAERPGRRIFAAADGGRTVWASEDAFSGEAP